MESIMKPLVKKFIESHKGFILHEDWDNLYDEAYEQRSEC